MLSIKDRLNALAWLAAAGLLEIKLAMRVNHQGGYARGLFHAKTGVFSDDRGTSAVVAGLFNCGFLCGNRQQEPFNKITVASSGPCRYRFIRTLGTKTF